MSMLKRHERRPQYESREKSWQPRRTREDRNGDRRHSGDGRRADAHLGLCGFGDGPGAPRGRAASTHALSVDEGHSHYSGGQRGRQLWRSRAGTSGPAGARPDRTQSNWAELADDLPAASHRRRSAFAGAGWLGGAGFGYVAGQLAVFALPGRARRAAVERLCRRQSRWTTLSTWNAL